MFRNSSGHGRRRLLLAFGVSVVALAPTVAVAQSDDDPRVGLAPGFNPWTEASSNIELLDNDPIAPPINTINSDLAFSGQYAIAGSFGGFQIYDLADPANPVLNTAFVCPGGQGDVSVYGNLLFMSVESTAGRIDCGTQGAPGPVNAERFRGVRIFDISDIDNPVQLPGVQLCRGSHTHTVVSDPNDDANIYIYNSGTAGVRPAAELAGCVDAPLTQDPVTSGDPTQWRIDVIQVPLAAPETAAVVSQPRIFTDPATGAFNGLNNTLPGTFRPGTTIPYGPTPNTNTCHDITAYPALGIAAGACQGDGILLDITDPVNPVRISNVQDPNFSYFHSATLSNDGSKVIFTDEWGGGTQARCLATDPAEWGADAIFDIDAQGDMTFASYFKMPAAQTAQENCVAHNASLVPVPGRDILVQAWYQGGLSVIDFTDSANPVEIAFYDRGPISATTLNLGGLWSTYWYNGTIYGTEILRGFDTFGLQPSDWLSVNELDAAAEVRFDEFNAQHQTPIVNAASFAVAGAYLDQAVRAGDIDDKRARQIQGAIIKAARQAEKGNDEAAVKFLRQALKKVGDRAPALRDTLEELIDQLS